jgi:uncharacterized membrane protein
VPTGPSRGVFLTVAGAAGESVEPGSPTHARLSAALRAYGDRLIGLVIASFRAATFRLRATVKVAPDAVLDDVLEAVRVALVGAFSFDARDFGQHVSVDEVAAVVHRVPGVVALDVNVLRRSDQDRHPALRPRLFAAPAAVAGAAVTPAELLLLDPSALRIRSMP